MFADAILCAEVFIFCTGWIAVAVLFGWWVFSIYLDN